MSERRMVLITGAAGFIGARICEIMHGSGYAKVRAGVHRWNSAARVGRLPIEIVLCNVLDKKQLGAAMKDVNRVVHCAVGSSEVNVQGTRNVLQAALDGGVKRIVHVSSIDVYGNIRGTIDESYPLKRSGMTYGDSKIAAEEAVCEYLSRGLSVSILRPTIVYGPFSTLWTVRPAEWMISHSWLIAEELVQGTCNLVYVDDLVQAIILAMDRKAAVGESFNVNGPDRPSWSEYFHALNDGLELPPLNPAGKCISRLSAELMMPVRRTAKWFLANYEKPIKSLYERLEIARQIMKYAEGTIRKTPTTVDFTLYSKVLDFPTDKATKLLDYKPRFDMAKGIRLSVAWLRHHRYQKVIDDVVR